MDSVLGRDSIPLRSGADLTWERERGGKGFWARIGPAHPCVLPSLCTSIPVVSSFQRKLVAKGKSSLQSVSSQGIDRSKPQSPTPLFMLSTSHSTAFPMTA